MPAVNGMASISQRTGGLRKPESIEPRTTLRTAWTGPTSRSGVKPMSRMKRSATTSVTPSIAARRMYGTPRFVTCAIAPPATVPDQHRRAGGRLGAAEDVLQVAPEAGRGQRVDQPRLGGAGEEGEAQAQQDRGDRPAPQRRVDLPHLQVEQGRDQQRGRAQHVENWRPARVGHDAGGDLEQHHPRREEGIGGEGLGVRQPGVQQEDGVDAPDDRRGEGADQGQRQVGPLDAPGGSFPWVRQPCR